MNRSDELLMPIPSDAAAKMWGVDKGPTNVLIETDEGQTFVVFISEAKGKFFLFNGWSDIVTHLRLKTGCFVIFNPLDATRFKVTYCVNGVSPGYLSYLDLLILRSYDDTLSDLISNIHLSDKTFHVKIETVGGKVCFTNGIDVEVAPVDCVKDGNPISDDPPAFAEQEVGRYIRFVRMVAEDFILPDDVSAMAKLHLGLTSITIRLMRLSPPIEFPNGTR
ncbi:putative transcription factor B3-Domain family [Helianthus annuus]|nr:putative transcription factor B3-Domain family [Helianthus annuus]